MIQRRDTLAYIEFIRGKYTPAVVAEADGGGYAAAEDLRKLLEAMTQAEQDRICTHTFEHLWRKMWGDASRSHRTNYDLSQAKFAQVQPHLPALVARYRSRWTEAEWGFPKGRRNIGETDLQCAYREFQEETGLSREKVGLVLNMEPLTEVFFGTDAKHYAHKYYLGMCDEGTEVCHDMRNPHMRREIGGIQWMKLDIALEKIRPASVEKRQVLLKVAGILKNFALA